MKENQEYVRKRRPINFTMEDLHEELEDDVFVSNTIPSTSRALPSRNCKPKNFHESDEESQDDTLSEIEMYVLKINLYILTYICMYLFNFL